MEKIRTRTAFIYLDQNEVLHLDILPGVTLDYEDALDNTLVIKNLSSGKKVLKLIDARSDFSITREAQNYIDEADQKQTFARAVVKGTGFSSMLINFFTSLNKPKIPTKIFPGYDEAYKWLMAQKTLPVND